VGFKKRKNYFLKERKRAITTHRNIALILPQVRLTPETL